MMKTIISDTEKRWLAPEEWPLVGQREGGRGEGGEREKAGLMVSKILLLLTTTMMMICSRSRCSALSLGKKRKEKKTALVVVVVEKRCAGLRANCHVLCVCVCVCVCRALLLVWAFLQPQSMVWLAVCLLRSRHFYEAHGCDICPGNVSVVKCGGKKIHCLKSCKKIVSWSVGSDNWILKSPLRMTFLFDALTVFMQRCT